MECAIYTDGSCIGNPGPGGWAVYIPSLNIELFDGHPNTTNNIMELTAMLKAFDWIYECKDFTHFKIYTDSTYVRNGINSWMHTWLKNNWKTSNNNDVKNKDLWIAIYGFLSKIKEKGYIITIQWVKAHSQDVHNNYVDKLAKHGVTLI